MNHVYKHIFSRTLGRLIVVPECVKSGQGRARGRRRTAAAMLLSSTMLASALAQNVLPTGGQVVSGAATIATSGGAMTVTQSTDRMIANWQSFSIGANNSVTFNQPGASSVALNRVIGQDPSQVLGALKANGQVFLVNPNGIMFGQGARVETGAFVASTLGISDGDFLKGNYRFSGTGGAIVNNGDLSGKVVALIAPSATNTGTIRGTSGGAALAAGTDVLLDFDGDGLLSVEVKASTVKTLVDNKGLIKADGGTAILTAKGASDALKGVVNNSGTVQARSIASRGGRILLLGDMQNGEVNASGSLRANRVETSARKVNIDKNLQIETKGGEWLIDPVNITIAGDMAAAIQTALGSGNVTVTTANGATWAGQTNGSGTDSGDITVNAPISWSSHILTLRADNNIFLNAGLSSTGATASDGLILQYGQTTGSGAYAINAPVNLAAGSLFQTKQGANAAMTYAVITSLGTQTSSNDGTLQGIRGNLSGNYVLGANIDASATSGWNSGAGFVPIGDNATNNNASRFTGVFDGLGHTIGGLRINRPTMEGVGLFGRTSGATIRNIGIESGVFAGHKYVGSLAGWNEGGSVSRSYAAGTTVTATNIGPGFDADDVGGLVGLNWSSTISQSYATGSVSGARYVGGLVGYNIGTVSRSWANASVYGFAYVGGLVGFNIATVSQTYATGSVTADGPASGGLVGKNEVGSVVSESYATGAVSGQNLSGGLVGWNAAEIYNSYSGLTTAQLRDPFTFINAGWDFSTVWGKSTANENSGYMMLRGASSDLLYDAYVKLSGNVSTAYGTPGSTAALTMTGGNTGAVIIGWGSAARNAGSYDLSAPNVLSLTTRSGAPVYVDSISGTLTIDPRVVSLHGSRIYDGSTSLAAPAFTLDNLANGETLTLTGSGQLADKNVGSDKAVSRETLALGDGTGLAANYTLAGGSYTADIVPATISAVTGIRAVSRTYDGTSAVSLNTAGAAFNGLVAGDTLTAATASGRFVDKNAGTGKTVNITGLSLGGEDAGNYILANTTATTTADVAKATISAITGITGSSRTYDGTTAASLNIGNASFGDMIAGDSLTVATAIGTFNDKSAGMGKMVSITGLSLGGNDAGNYMLASPVATTTADIAKATISAVTGITAETRTYDATTAAMLNTGAAGFIGIVAGDTLTVATATGNFSDKNAGSGKAVSITGLSLGGADAGNYTLASTAAATTADIGRATISGIAGITTSNKTYDATTAATLNTGAAAFTGMIAGDTLTVATATGTFSDKNAGSKAVSITGLSLGGADAGNYTLASTTATATADIARAAISGIAGITANNKTYDATTAATLNTGAAAFTGMMAGDMLTVATATGTFSDKNAGSKAVSITGLSLGGIDAGNYTLASTTAATTADIGRATVSGIAGITASNKTYDATTAATLNTGAAAFTGTMAGDTLTVATATGTFSDKGAGSGKAVSITGLSLGGIDAGNYTLASTTAAATADIGRATISGIAGITASNKTYDATTAATLNTGAVAFTGLVSGDTLTVATATGTFSDKGAGSGKAVSITGLSLGGADAGNYTLASTTAAATADIGRATISGIAGITASNKTYDATTAATLNTGAAAFTGMITGDTLTVATATGTFSDKNAGSKAVSITGLSLGGADAGNYTLASTTAATTAEIGRAPISITGITASNKTYDATTAAMLHTGAAAFTGMMAGDMLTVATATGTFSDKNAGSGKAVSITGLSLGGADAGNYTLAATTATATADIAKAMLAISGFTAQNKTYDGTTSATIASAGTLGGVVAGDIAWFVSTGATFADRNAGTAKSVALNGTLAGADAGNYVVAGGTTSTADITRTTITSITGITANNKPYDGNAIAMLNLGGAGFAGMVAGDRLTVATATGSFADPNPGQNKSVSVTGLSLGGADAGNYTLADTTAATTASIQVVIPPLTPQQTTSSTTGAVGTGAFPPPTPDIFAGGPSLIDVSALTVNPAPPEGSIVLRRETSIAPPPDAETTGSIGCNPQSGHGGSACGRRQRP